MDFKDIKEAKNFIFEEEAFIAKTEKEIKSSFTKIKEAEKYIKKYEISEDDIYPGACFCFEEKDLSLDNIILMIVIKNGNEYSLSGNNFNDPCVIWHGLNDIKTKQDILNYFKFRSHKIIKAPYKVVLKEVD